jgi:xeroderma pigmentosum group C-complementing protein
MSKNVSEMDIAELLALGEGISQPSHHHHHLHEESGSGSDSDGSSDAFEDVEDVPAHHHQHHDEPKQPGVSSDGLVITVEAPSGLSRKKKKSFDPEAFIRRKLAQRSRENQVLTHKLHVLCIFAGYKFLNQHVLNSPDLHAVALSTVPSSSCYPGKRADLDYLEKLAAWFKKKFKLFHSPDDESISQRPVLDSVKSVFETKRAVHPDHLVYAFVALTRAVGLSSRLVVSFRPVSAKLNVPRTSVTTSSVVSNDLVKKEGEPGPSRSSSVVKKDGVKKEGEPRPSTSRHFAQPSSDEDSDEVFSPKISAKKKICDKSKEGCSSSSSAVNKSKNETKASSKPGPTTSSSTAIQKSRLSSKQSTSDEPVAAKKTHKSPRLVLKKVKVAVDGSVADKSSERRTSRKTKKSAPGEEKIDQLDGASSRSRASKQEGGGDEEGSQRRSTRETRISRSKSSSSAVVEKENGESTAKKQSSSRATSKARESSSKSSSSVKEKKPAVASTESGSRAEPNK